MADTIPPRPVFRAPIAGDMQAPQRAGDVSFADLVRMLAQSIADAQLALDTSSAEMMAQLATTMVDVVPHITETIGTDGSMTFTPAPVQRMSLLDLGLTPTFYQFSQATVEVTMDLHVVESEHVEERGKRKIGLFAGTQDIKTDRTFNRDMRATSKVTATLVPVPPPARSTPIRTTNAGGS